MCCVVLCAVLNMVVINPSSLLRVLGFIRVERKCVLWSFFWSHRVFEQTLVEVNTLYVKESDPMFHLYVIKSRCIYWTQTIDKSEVAFPPFTDAELWYCTACILRTANLQKEPVTDWRYFEKTKRDIFLFCYSGTFLALISVPIHIHCCKCPWWPGDVGVLAPFYPITARDLQSNQSLEAGEMKALFLSPMLTPN